MSVLTNLPVLPNRLFILFRYLLYKGTAGEAKEKLEAFFSPPALRPTLGGEETETPNTTIFDQVLKEAKLMRLVEEEDDRIRLSQGFTNSEIKRTGEEVLFLALVERRLLQPEEAQESGQKSFAYALCWLLMQNPLEPLDYNENYVNRVTNDLGEGARSYQLTNKSRCQNLLYWARFLGFCTWIAAGPQTVVIPDPTLALARFIPTLFQEEQKMWLADCLIAWGALCPVLEMGVVRMEVEALARRDLRTEPRVLSKSTSLALRRLEHEGVIKLERLSDGNVVSVFSDGELKGFSHIKYLAR
jgi:hypothetical protein